jgi:hypothetical protein
MAKLMVRRGKGKKNVPFHPSLRIESTGFHRHQVVAQFFREGIFPGMNAFPEYGTVESMVKHYFEELRRTGHVPIEDISTC